MNDKKWRRQYDEEANQFADEKTKVWNDQPDLTQQHFAADANLNTIVQRFGIHDGAINPAPIDPAYYGDFTSVTDFRFALDTVRDANEKFNALPADTRSKFNNDPVRLWQWVNDPNNAEEAVKLKLLARDAAPPATPATPAPIIPAPAPIT